MRCPSDGRSAVTHPAATPEDAPQPHAGIRAGPVGQLAVSASQRSIINMDQHRRGRNILTLGGLILLALAYGSWLYYQRTLTGTNKLDGIVGVLLGLYICSHPAANALDVLFFRRAARPQVSSGWSGVWWLALNVLVLLIGWIVIIIGTIRLTGSAA